MKLLEICLWFCAECGRVCANQRRLPADRANVDEFCPECDKETVHSPVAVEIKGRIVRFVTRTQ